MILDQDRLDTSVSQAPFTIFEALIIIIIIVRLASELVDDAISNFSALVMPTNTSQS